METGQSDILIIGGGVIGCAVAEYLSRKMGTKNIVVVESGPRLGEGVTSRNSGVIHAGIYYPPQSLKAQSCVRGNALLYNWVERNRVPFQKTGKLIVARGKEQGEVLEKTFKNAITSEARDLRLINKAQIKELEPNLDFDGAIFSPWTGIVDPYLLTESLMNKAAERGAILLLRHRVLEIENLGKEYKVNTDKGAIVASVVINCAGLFADDIAAMVGINKYKIYPYRGDYFTFNSPLKFSHLIYPVKDPKAPGLGIHLTLDLSGKYKLGPDVELGKSKNDFAPAEEKKEKFRAAAEKLFGKVHENQLHYDTCGVRPKLRGPKDTDEKDFVLSQDLPGFINLVGIESPGLTASMDLAERVGQLL
jgi:L-2-hydroxyglutarate oxidase LhgO